MRKMTVNLICTLMVALGLLFSVNVTADTLRWTYPTERENGTALEAAEIEFTTLYRNGTEFAKVPAPATQTDIPEVCSEVSWTATVTSVLESAHSSLIVQPVDEVGCAPKSPSLIGFSPGSGN